MENLQNGPGRDGNPTASFDYPAEPAGVSSSLRCHPGAVRAENQDCVGRSQSELGELFLVLDGVGGRSGGAIASSLGLAEYQRFIASVPAGSDPLDALQQATTWVNQCIDEAKASAAPELQEMASTVALVLLSGDKIYVGHIGDSRVYRMRGGQLELLTRDHSVVQRMIAEGILTEEQAQTHPSSHILTRSLGQTDAVLELSSHQLQPNDVILLCSDGLWGYSPASGIEAALAAPGATSTSIADSLLQLALSGDAGDNISIVVIRAGEAWSAPTQSREAASAPARRGRLYMVLAFIVLLAGAAYYMLVWSPWAS